jgi:hypothetical protein
MRRFVGITGKGDYVPTTALGGGAVEVAIGPGVMNKLFWRICYIDARGGGGSCGDTCGVCSGGGGLVVGASCCRGWDSS